MLQVRTPLVEWRAEPRTFDYDSLATWKIDRRWLNLLDAREIICANEGSGNALFRAVSEAHRGSPTTTSSPTLTGELQLRCAMASGELPDGWHVVGSSRQTSYSELRDKFTRLRWVGKLQLCKNFRPTLWHSGRRFWQIRVRLRGPASAKLEPYPLRAVS